MCWAVTWTFSSFSGGSCLYFILLNHNSRGARKFSSNEKDSLRNLGLFFDAHLLNPGLGLALETRVVEDSNRTYCLIYHRWTLHLSEMENIFSLYPQFNRRKARRLLNESSFLRLSLPSLMLYSCYLLSFSFQVLCSSIRSSRRTASGWFLVPFVSEWEKKEGMMKQEREMLERKWTNESLECQARREESF